MSPAIRTSAKHFPPLIFDVPHTRPFKLEDILKITGDEVVRGDVMLRKLKVISSPVALCRLLRVQSVWGVAEIGNPFWRLLEQGFKNVEGSSNQGSVLWVCLHIHRYIEDANFRLPNTSNLM